MTFKESISNPESISSKIQSFGLINNSCKISFFFFSPPEKPVFRSLERNDLSRPNFSAILPISSKTFSCLLDLAYFFF